MRKISDVEVKTWTYIRVANGQTMMSFILGSQRIYMSPKIAEDFAAKLLKASQRIHKARKVGKS